jgi:hypothetical protein
MLMKLTADWNYKFYMHAKGEEIWLGGSGTIPTHVAAKTLGNGNYVSVVRRSYLYFQFYYISV